MSLGKDHNISVISLLLLSAHKILQKLGQPAECHPIHCSYAVMSELMPNAQDGNALAFALTRTKSSLPYSNEVA